MYTIFTNRYYILEFLLKKNKLEYIYSEKGSYAEEFCINKNLNFSTYSNKKDSFKLLNNSLNEKIILNGYKYIIPKKILIKFKYQPINIHPSLLPLYAGQKVVKKIYQDKPKYIGATVHKVIEKVDSGQILSQVKEPFGIKSKIIFLYHALFKLELKAFKNYFRESEKVNLK